MDEIETYLNIKDKKHAHERNKMKTYLKNKNEIKI